MTWKRCDVAAARILSLGITSHTPTSAHYPQHGITTPHSQESPKCQVLLMNNGRYVKLVWVQLRIKMIKSNSDDFMSLVNPRVDVQLQWWAIYFGTEPRSEVTLPTIADLVFFASLTSSSFPTRIFCKRLWKWSAYHRDSHGHVFMDFDLQVVMTEAWSSPLTA